MYLQPMYELNVSTPPSAQVVALAGGSPTALADKWQPAPHRASLGHLYNSGLEGGSVETGGQAQS